MALSAQQQACSPCDRTQSENKKDKRVCATPNLAGGLAHLRSSCLLLASGSRLRQELAEIGVLRPVQLRPPVRQTQPTATTLTIFNPVNDENPKQRKRRLPLFTQKK
jgi:hypothetical protein